MKKIINLLFFLMVAISIQAQPILVDKIVGVVGDKIILKSEVEVQYQQMVQQGNMLPADIKCDILDQLLMQKMLLIQAEADSIIISDDDVESELERRIRYFISLTGSQQKLEEYYQKSVIEIKEEFRPAIREQLLANKMQQRISGDVKITPNEVKEFFDDIPQDSLPYFNAEVEVGHLVIFPKPGSGQKEAARKKLEDIRTRIVNGEDFGTLAILYSEDPSSAAEKGELPEFGRNDGFVPEFIGASFKLKNPGDLSEIFETQFGYHIIQLLEKMGERVKVRHILIIPKPSSEDVRNAKALLDSIQTELTAGTLAWTDAVKRYSDDERTKGYNGMFVNQQTGDTYFEIDQLGAMDKDLPFLIDPLKPGQFSKAVAYADPQRKTGYRIIYLKNETQPHRANLKDDYTKIQAVALAEKKDRLTQEWLRDKIRQSYIKIDPAYNNCEVIKEWISYNP